VVTQSQSQVNVENVFIDWLERFANSDWQLLIVFADRKGLLSPGNNLE